MLKFTRGADNGALPVAVDLFNVAAERQVEISGPDARRFFGEVVVER